jgi:tetratricopeptide (TPR) repeat protein
MLVAQPEPLSIEQLFQWAVRQHKDGHTEAAIAGYQKVITLAPDLAQAHYNMGTLYYQKKNWTAAINHFRCSVDRKPLWIPALSNWAAALQQDGQNEKAVSAYRRVLSIEPGHRQAIINLSSLYIEMRRYRQAIAFLTQAKHCRPDDHLILNNLGLAYHLSGRLDSAVDTFEAAIAAEPKYAKTYHNLGNVYLDLENMDATVTYYLKALELTPHDAQAHHNMGNLYLKQLDLINARRYFETSVKLRPAVAKFWISLSNCALLQGDLAVGWKHFHWRYKTKNSCINTYPYQYKVPHWDGASFQGRRLLVHCEQGFGDTIQFSRFLPLIKGYGGQVTFQLQKQLLALYENFPGVDTLQVLPDHQTQSIEEDLYVSLMDVPDLLNLTLDSIPAVIPYLFADLRKRLQWRQHIHSNRMKVGVVWSGNPIHKKDKQRSCHLDHFLGLKEIKKIQIYSLQKVLTDAEQRMLSTANGIIHLGDHFGDFDDTAAAVANLDLIITVDTSVAHLAGAMGKPTWLLLPYLPDWRWMLNRMDSPWYPTLKLIRQSTPGNWDSIFEEIKRLLHTASF